MPSPPWDAVIDLIRRSRSFLLTTHVHPDGDALGVELALARWLKGEGKQVRIVNPDPLPTRYAFLDGGGEIESWSDAAGVDLLASTDVVFVLDINRWQRLGEMAGPLQAFRGARVCIDHHPLENGFADFHLIDDSASAAAELVHELLSRMGARFSLDLLEPLYVAIVTDTGSFRFSNTTPRALEIAADAVRAGARPDRLYAVLYEGYSPARMRLVGRILQDLQLECAGRLAHFTVTRRLLDEIGVADEETEGLVDYPRTVRGVQVVLSFQETREGGTKVSLRSRGDGIDVNALASRFGGGGHARAAGIQLEDSPDKIREILLDAVRGLL